jgi:copper chaperone CopZ
VSTSKYAVTGMTCGHCESSVREEVSDIDGVQDVEVSAQTGMLTVTASGAIDDAKVLNAVKEAGYSAVPVS